MPVPTISDYETRPARERPRISVITTVRDGERTLARTIDSVRAQRITDLEYIVIDAGSRDRTLDIVRANADIITFWKSEPDRGISDGFNKGITFSRGKYVILLNADDWLSPGQIACGIETLERTGVDFVFGDLIYHDAEGIPVHVVKGNVDYARCIGRVMPALNHPTVIVRRAAYEKHGLFDLGLRYAMDYELLLRFHRAGCLGAYDCRMIGHMALAGRSDRNNIAALEEVRDVSIRHGELPLGAWLRFLYRVLKGALRRALQKLLPRAIFQRLRRKVNPDLADIA